jgi:hypothetical protein
MRAFADIPMTIGFSSLRISKENQAQAQMNVEDTSRAVVKKPFFGRQPTSR